MSADSIARSRDTTEKHKSKRQFGGGGHNHLQGTQKVFRMPAAVRYIVLEHYENFEICSIRPKRFRSTTTEGDSAAQIGNLARLCDRCVTIHSCAIVGSLERATK